MNRLRRLAMVTVIITTLMLASAGCGSTPTPLPSSPTGAPTEAATETPTEAPTDAPTSEPTAAPTESATPEPEPTTAPDENTGSEVKGWTGMIDDLPAGNQFGQVFVRENGEEYDISGTSDAAREAIREAKESRAQVQIWGTLYTGVPASEAKHIEVERISILSSPDEGTSVEGWTGTVHKLPPGNQFGQYFLRDDGERYGVTTPDDAIREQFGEAAWTGATLQVWGTLHTGVPASEARTIEVTRLEITSSAATEPRDLTPFAEVTTSSSLSSDRYGTYHGYAAIDGQRETAWVEGAEGSGQGEWIRLAFPEPIEVHSLSVDIGFDKSEELFMKNNRIRKATFQFSDGQTVSVEFPDARGLQTVPLTELIGSPVETDWVQLTIEEVFEGTAYDDTCLSEIELYGLTQ